MAPLYHSDQDIPTTSGIYRIVCSTNQKLYIGSTKNLRKRRQEHFNDLRHDRHPNRLLQNAWNKYGEAAFAFEVLELVLVPFLLEREQHWLDKLKPFAPRKGFNIAQSAQAPLLGTKASPETIEKLRISHLGQPSYWAGKKRDPEMIARAAAKRRGKPSPRKPGYTHSPEHREKIRGTLTGYKHTEEAKRNMGNSHRNKERTPETKAKISATKLGHTVSEEARTKSRTSHTFQMKTLVLTDPNGITYTVTGIRQFCKDHNLDRSTLLKVAKGIYPTHKGWKARYPD